MSAPRIRPFPRFYEYYLGEHRNPTCRLLHFTGSRRVMGNQANRRLTHLAAIAAAASVMVLNLLLLLEILGIG